MQRAPTTRIAAPRKPFAAASAGSSSRRSGASSCTATKRRSCAAAPRSWRRRAPEAGPDVEIFVECSEFFSPRTLPMVDAALHPFRPGWFEEPVPFENAAVMAAMQAQIRTPIATGERLLSRFEYRELLVHGGCRIIQPDLMHAGGITEVRRIASLADTWYVPVAPHNPGGPICTVAAMHLAASIPNFYILEQMEPQRAIRDLASRPAVRFEDGHFLMPEGPGLGLEPDLEALKDLPFKQQPRVERNGALWR
ncbi:MAG: enolase C-terminal domain-like protein [Geminicoccaceae bacterium]